MTRLKAGRKLDAVDAKIAVLEAERRDIEVRTLGAEIAEAERRERYFAIPDATRRRRAIALTRRLHELRAEQRAAAVAYWESVCEETRAKLAGLASDAPNAPWRRAIWWDVATVLWILVGAGWLYRAIPGALAGAGLSAAWAWFIVRNRRKTRPVFIRQGEDKLRSSESELQQARRYAAQGESQQPIFSETEEQSGVADPG